MNDAWVVVWLSWLVLVVLGSALGNLLVLYVVLFHLQLRTVTNHLIVALSVTDLLSSLIAMPPVLLAVAQATWFGGDDWCVAQGTLASSLGTLSTLTLTCITLERYWSVVRLPNNNSRVWIAGLMVLLGACLSVVVSIPWAFLLNDQPDDSDSTNSSDGTTMDYYKPEYHHCMYAMHSREAPGGGLGYSVTYMILCGVLPFSAMSTGAGFMYRMIRRSTRRTQPVSAQTSSLRFSGEIRTAGTVIVMVLLAAVTKGPYFILGLSLTAANKPFPPWLDTLCMWLYWTSCAVNPIVYSVRNPNVGVILNLRREGDGQGRSHRDRGSTIPEQGQAYVIPSVRAASPTMTNSAASDPRASTTKEPEQSSALTLETVDVSALDVRSDSIPSVLLFYADRFNPRKGSDFSAATNSTTTTTL